MTGINICANFGGKWVSPPLIVGMIKDYVIVTIVYLNAFYREK